MRELQAFGVVPEGTRVLASAGHAPPVGFPILSTANRALLGRARSAVADLGLSNVAITGIQSALGVVFQPDVLTYTWREVRRQYEQA
jgi:hypothetical protein